jgi:hypothetical protein
MQNRTWFTIFLDWLKGFGMGSGTWYVEQFSWAIQLYKNLEEETGML